MPFLRLVLVLVLGLGALAGAQELVVYCARSRALVEPLILRFQEETGLRVHVRYGTQAELVALLLEEGARSPADVFWGYEASLATLARRGLLQELPAEFRERVAPAYRVGDERWVPTSIRVRVLAYAPARVTPAELPASVLELGDPRYRGRVGWAPPNAGFQTFLTGLRLLVGEEEAQAWVEALRQNQAQPYPNNIALLQALAAGEIDFALTNHYYLYRFRAADPAFPVEQILFAPGDPGNLLLASGAGILRTARNPVAAQAFLAFLLGEAGQTFFTHDLFEFPAVEDVSPHPALAPLAEELAARRPAVDLGDLWDLPGTLELLRRAGVL